MSTTEAAHENAVVIGVDVGTESARAGVVSLRDGRFVGRFTTTMILHEVLITRIMNIAISYIMK